MAKQMTLVMITTLALLLQIEPGRAEERHVTLQQAIATAMENNHEMKATRNSLFAQREDVGIARSFLLPRVSFEERVSRTNNPPGVFMSKLNQERFAPADFDISSLNNPNPVTDFQTLVSVDQTIFAGKVFVGLDMAKKEYAAKSDDYGRKKEETALHVVETYLRIRTAKEYVGVASAGLDDAKEHLRIAEARYKNSVGLYSDVLRAKTSVIEAEQRIVSARKNLAVAKRALGMLLGMSEPVDSADEKLEFPVREPEYYGDGSTSRKDVRALQLRHENTANGIRLAKSKYLPSLGFRASYQLNDRSRVFGSEGESWWLMGLLTWDLFDGAGREYEWSKARYKQMETEEQLNGLRQLVSFKIAEAHLAAEEAAKHTELSKAALEAAQEGRKLVKSRFENSLSPMIDLLDVQLSVDRERANVVARENELRLAVMRLAYESGTILKDLGVE